MLAVQISYEIDGPEGQPWKHVASQLDEGVIELAEGMGAEFVGSDFDLEKSVRSHVFILGDDA